jgi:DNA-binding response OmpR family regulator
LKSGKNKLVVDQLELDPGTMSVTREGKPIELNRTCLTILNLLMKAYPNVVSRQNLETALWGDQPPGSNTLKSHLYTLRTQIDKPFSKAMLKTVHGFGYKLEGADETPE